MTVATTFVHDTFVEPDNSLLLLHQPESGGPLKLLPNFPGSLTDPPTCTGTVNGVISYSILGNRAVPSGTGGGTNAGVYYSGVPSSADYDIYFSITVPNPFSSDSYHGVLFRVNTSSGDHYRLQYYSFSGFRYWHIQKRVSSSESQVGSNASQVLTPGNTYKYKLSISGTTFTLYDVTAGSPGTQVGTWSDSSISAAGRVGLWAQGNTSSIVFDDFRACNAGTNPEDYTLDLPVWPSQGRCIPGATSGNFTVTLQGANTGPVTITPAVSGVSGTFSPTSLVLSGSGASGTFTFTPSSSTPTPSVATISVTNGGALNDPASVSFTVDYFSFYGLSVWKDGATNTRIGPSQTGPNYPTDPTSNSIVSNDQYQGLRDVYRVVQKYIGGTAFNRSIDVSRLSYRNTFGSSGQIGPIYNYNWYALNDFYETGSTASREFGMLTARYTPYAAYSPSSLTLYVDNSSSQMRETSYVVLSKCLASRMGYVPAGYPTATIHRFCQSLLTLLTDYTAGPGNRKVNNATSQFFVGLAFQALIVYWNHYINDSGTSIPDTLNPGQTVLQLAQSIPAAIKNAIDWMMSPSRSQAISNVANNGSGLFRLTVPSTANWTTGKKVEILNTGVSAIDNKFWTVTVINSTTLDLQGSTYAAGWVSGGIVNPLEWDSAKQTFAYRDDTPTDASNPTAIDYATWKLNGDFIGGTCWYYMWSSRINGSRNPTYRDYGEKIFRGNYPVALQGVDHGCASSNKEWTEMYYQVPAALDWISQGDQPWNQATSLAVTPPATRSGAPGTWSGNYVVTLSDGLVPSPAGYPVQVTPSDGGAGGTFMPATQNIATDFPVCVFRYRPASAAAGTDVSLTFSAPGLASTSASTYSVTSTPATIATGLVISGPSSVVPGQWTPYTVSLYPAGSVPGPAFDVYGGMVTATVNASVSPLNSPKWIQAAGDATPSGSEPGWRLFSLTAENPSKTFWFKAPSSGSWTMTASTVEGPSWTATNLPITASGTASLSSVTMVGPVSGFKSRVSDLFNVVPDGSGAMSVTLSDGGAGGTFLPSGTINWATTLPGGGAVQNKGGYFLPGSIASFAYQAPANSGTVTITATATGAASPSPLSFSVNSLPGSAPTGLIFLTNGSQYLILSTG